MGIVTFLFAAEVVLSSQAECMCVRREHELLCTGGGGYRRGSDRRCEVCKSSTVFNSLVLLP